jgi:diguanylate cyclase (GGDEF)-like protein/PAS domain S-box-containing protein
MPQTVHHDAQAERSTFALIGTRLGLWDWDMVTGETVFNERWADIVGYTLEELQPTKIDTWLRLAHPDDLPASEAAIEAHVRGEAPAYDVEVRMIHRDGHIVWVHDRGQVMTWNEDGTPRRMVGTHEDITDRIEATQRLRESEERFSRLFSEHHAAMLLIDPIANEIVDANPAAGRLYGFAVSEMQGMPLTRIDPSAPELIASELAAIQEQHGGTLLVTNLVSGGQARKLEVHTSLIRIGERDLLFSIVTDVSEREAQADRLRQAAAVFNTVSEGILISDAEGIVTDVNAAFTGLTGFPRAALLGHHAMEIADPALPDDRARAVGARHVDGRGGRDEVPIRHADGSSSPGLVTVSPIRAADGTVSGFVTLVADLAEHVEAEKANLDHATTIDHVTELANRRGFSAALTERLTHRRRGDAGSAVLVVDLDRFKDINDSYGSAAGDDLLRAVAQRLSGMVGTDDLVARLGSDEFAVFAQAITRGDDADLLARRIQDVLAPPIHVADDVEVFITACVGVCMAGPGDPTADTILQQSATALSDAKRAGSGSIRHHDDALTTVSRARLSLETRLRRSWENQEFVVHYQPQVDVATEAIVGAEALIRWPIAGGGQVPPGSFIPLAEHIGLIDDIGAWVLDEACAQGRAWQLEGLPELTIAVNVSARQVVRGTFTDQVGQCLRRHSLPPHTLELELTESALLETGERTLALLEALSSLGVRLSIDDFGTGYSSFDYLKRFPLDQLKIDRSFVSDLETDAEARAITAAIVGLGHTLGLTVLAEGVETPAQLSVLRTQRCDLFQGYLLSPALPPDAFGDLVRSIL